MSKRWTSRNELSEPAGGATSPDRLIRKFLPLLRGHVTNVYSWMDARGNCLLSVDDLIQVASITLMKLADEWHSIVAEHPEFVLDENGTHDAVFFAYLKKEVKFRLLNEHQRERRAAFEGLTSEIDGETYERPELYDSTDGEMHDRTGVRRRPDGPWWRAILSDIMAYWDTQMTPKEKLVIALRYFDELPRDRVSELTGTSSVLYPAIVKRWRAHTRNQLRNGDGFEVVEHVNSRAWEPPELLTVYLRDRHQKDIHEYLGIVTLSFRADPDYLVRILDVLPFRTPGANDQIDPEQIETIDRMAAEGHSYAEIGRTVGVSRGSIGLRLDSDMRQRLRDRASC